MTNEQLGRVIQNAYNEGYEKAMGDTQSRARKAAEEIVKSFAMVENIGWEKLAENIIARHFSEGEE